MSKHIMLDIETMGTGPDAAIVAIGAVYFGPEGLGAEFYRTINLADSAQHGSLGPTTVLWWLQQDLASRQQLYTATCPLKVALQDFSDFARGADGVWGFGATFDNVIVRTAYSRVGLPCPWHYRADRCFRTLAAMHPQHVWPARVGTHHNALDDAKTQALAAIGMLWPVKAAA